MKTSISSILLLISLIILFINLTLLSSTIIFHKKEIEELIAIDNINSELLQSYEEYMTRLDKHFKENNQEDIVKILDSIYFSENKFLGHQ